jgi:hypothetical protein
MKGGPSRDSPGNDVIVSLNIRGYAAHKMEEMGVGGICKLVTRPGAQTNIYQIIKAEESEGKRKGGHDVLARNMAPAHRRAAPIDGVYMVWQNEDREEKEGKVFGGAGDLGDQRVRLVFQGGRR